MIPDSAKYTRAHAHQSCMHVEYIYNYTYTQYKHVHAHAHTDMYKHQQKANTLSTTTHIQFL